MRAQRRRFVMFVVAAWALAPAALGQSAKPLLEFYAAQAKAADPTFSAFSAERGEHLFRTKFSTGKPDTPSCTACHTTDPKNVGQTRAGKDIDPMAASANPKRYTDQAKAEKWFGRNCNNVLGRECTATEKGDFITYMLSQ
jgi:mono/diheme cytochrome c family protein